MYVRSTARVYEIYYAPSLQGDNEYLCTVRCSAASVEDKTGPVTDVKEVISVNSESPNGVLPKSRVAGENKIGSNEDDWVEVGLPVGRVDEGNTYSPNQTSTNIRSYQDYYEATAEINDSDPCMSLTLRLLSLQSKGCVYVDEVYVFADPIDTDDTADPTVNAESSASSLMTMLVPTLLGITKSRSVQLHNENSPHVEKRSQSDSQPTTSNNPVNLVNQQDEKFLEQSESKAELSLSQFSVPIPDKDKICVPTMRNDFSSNRAEVLLEQLVSRVSRIEDICMRFEENMLKPINHMQERLERVEQQVNLLAKHCQRPGSPSCPTLETNQINYSQLCGDSESEMTGSFSSEIHKPPEDRSSLKSAGGDDKDEENEVLELPKNVKPKKAVSIDDALAAALAGFSSFTKADDSPTSVPLKSPEEECIKSNQASIDTPLGSSSESETSFSCESPKPTTPEFSWEENGEAPTSYGYMEIPDDIFRLEGTSEEAVGPSESFSHESCITDAQLVKQDPIQAVKMLNFDKTDILKYFPDQSPDESKSTVDFESPILEVKFVSLGNGGLESHLQALLSKTDDPATDEGVFVTPQLNENTTSGNILLVDFDGDDVGEAVREDLPHIEQETSFASLI